MPAQRSNVCTWDFTRKASGITPEALKAACRLVAKKWAFQLEVGTQTGYEHYQGRISLKTKARHGPDWPETHWSVTSNENRDNSFYVLKEDTRKAGPWTDADAYIPRQVRDIVLRPWQQAIINSANTWDTRTINILHCPGGNIGKSTLKTYAGAHRIGRALPMMESYKDYMRMVMDTPKCKLYLIDFPRSQQRLGCGNLWSAIETIKDGYAYDDRYGFREEYFDCPTVWVFTNNLPDRSHLSVDRWKTWTVIDGELKEAEF